MFPQLKLTHNISTQDSSILNTNSHKWQPKKKKPKSTFKLSKCIHNSIEQSNQTEEEAKKEKPISLKP